MSRILAALMVLCMVGLAGAQPNEGGSQARRQTSKEAEKGEKSPEIVPMAARVDASSSQTSVTQGVVVHPSTPAPSNLDTTIPLSLNQVPLDQLVRFMADTTGKTVIKQRDLNTQISVNAPKPVTKREALELIYSALQLDNIYVSELDDMLMLINFQSLKNIRLESIPFTVDIQSLPDSLRIVQKIYKFDNVNPSSVRAHLELFMPNTSMTIEPQSNTLIITDQVKRIKAYDKIIKALDTPVQDKVLDVYKLNSANAGELTQLVRSLIQSGALADSGDTSETVIRPTRNGSDIMMIPDTRLNWIIALCPKNQKTALDQLVAAFDVNKTDDYVVQIYKLEKSDASQLTSLLNMVINNKGLAAVTQGAGKKGGALPVSGKSSKLWKRLSEQLGASGGPVGKPAQAGDVLLIPEYRLNWIIAIMRPDLKGQMDDLVKQFDIEKKMDVQTRVLKLKTANAQAIYSTVYNLVAGLSMSNPRDYIRIMPSQDNASLLVMSSESNYKLVEELADKVQTMPENRIVQIYKLNTADASQLMMILQAIITNRGLKGDTVAAMGSWGQPGDVMLYPEYRKNWLIAILRPDLKPQLDELVKQFDSDQVNDVQARSLELKSNNALGLTITVQRLISNMPINSARDYVTVMPSEDGKKLIVMSSEAKFKVVEDLVKTVETVPTDKVMQVYPMKYADVVQLASFINTVLTNKGKYKSSVGAAAGDSEGRGMGFYLRRMMESGGAANGGDLLMIPETRLNQLVVIMKPEIKPELDKLIEQFDVESTQEIKPRMLDLKGANPAQVSATISRLLMGRQVNSSKDVIQVMPSDDGKQLIVMSTENNFKIVEEMVATVAIVPASKTLTIYKLVNAQATQLISLANSILATKGISTSAGGAATGSNSLGGEDEGRGFRYLRRMMSGGGSATGVSGDVLMIPEVRLNWIIAITKPEVKPELDAVVQQFDVERIKDVQTRLLDLKGGNAASVFRMVDRIISDLDLDRPDNPKDYVRVFPSDDNKKLVVMSNAENYKMIEEMVNTLVVIPGEKTVEVYKIVNADAASIAATINTIVTSKGKLTSSISGGAPAPSGGGEDGGSRFMRRMMMMGAAAGGATNTDILMIPDTRLNWIFAIVTATAKPEVEALIKQLDIKSTQDVQTRLLDLKGANATQVAGTVTRLLVGRQTTNPKDMIQVMPSDDGKKLIVMSNEANYQIVQDMVATVAVVPANKELTVYKLLYADSTQLISTINSILATKNITVASSGAAPATSAGGSSDDHGFRRMQRMMAAMGATAGANGSGDVLMIPDARLNWIIAITRPEVKSELDALVKQFDVKSSTEGQPRLLDLKGANATQVAATVTRLLAGRQTTTPQDSIQVMPSDDGKKLIVMASEANYKIVEEMVATVAVVPANKEINVYKLVYADASQLISMINSVLTTKNISVSAAGAAPAMPAGGSSDDHGGGFRRMQRMMSMGAMSGSASGSGDVLMIPDTRLNWIISISKPEVKSELDALVKQFDVDKIKDVQTRMLDLKGASAMTVSNTINNLIMGMMTTSTADPKNFIRVLPSDDNKKLIVLSSEANYQMIEEMAATVAVMPSNRAVSIYKLVYADASQLITLINSIYSTRGISTSASGAAPVMPGSSSSSSSGSSDSGGFRYMRRMMMGGGAGSTNPASDVIMIPEIRLNWLIAMTKPELKTDLDALVKQFDVESSREVQARLLPVKTVQAQAMATMVNNLLAARSGSSSSGSDGGGGGMTPQNVIRVMPTDDNQQLIVMSSEANYKVVQDLVKTLDTIPDDRVVDTYKLKFADAGELTALLQNLIAKSPLMKGSASATASTGNLYSRYSRAFGGGGYGSSYGGGYGSSYGGGYGSGGYGGSAGGPAAASGSVQVGNIILIPDTRLNWIIVICPKDQKVELDKLILQFDIEKPKDQQARVIELKHADATELAQTLSQILREQTAAGRREAVRVSATDDGTKLLVWSTEANFKDIQKMVLDLDVDTPKDVQTRMIDVQYAEATQLATTINNLFRDQYFGGSGSKREYVRVSSTEDGMRLLVMSSEANYKIIEDMIKKLDTKDAESQVTKVYKVEHLEAQDMADQLTRLFEERNRSNMSNGGMFDSYGGYGGYGRSRTSTQAPTPAIVPSPRNNTVMVMARPKDMDFLEQMVKELDVPIDPQSFEPRIYHIRNTDAAEVVNVMQSLFSGTGGRATQTTNYYFDSWRPNRNSQDKDAIEAVFGKLRFVVDRQTNTIVALSSNPKNYEIIDSVIEKLDQPDPENSEVMVFDLKYADALKIANQVNYLFSMGATQRPNTPQQNNNNNNNQDTNNANTDTINELQDEQVQDFVPLWGTAGNQLTSNRPGEAQRPINTMIGNVRVVPDIRSNKLMVAAPPVYFPTLTKLIESLDHNEPQVYITTRILELTRGKERRVGIRWTPDPNSIDPGELDGAVLALNQLGFIDTFGHGDQPDPTKTGVAAISRTFPPFGGSGSKTVAQTLKNGNSVISSDVNIALLIQLLVKNSQSRIFTEPGVTVNNNETGNIFFGSEFPFQTGTQYTDNGNRNVDVNYKPVGINLDIRPHINSNDEIVLKAAVENSNVRAELVNGQLIKDVRRFTTEVSLKNGETMVIGGILTDDGVNTKRGVPILSSIPVIKYLFSKKDDTQDMRELVFFVTPQIVETAEDSRAILTQTNQKIKSIEELDPQKMDMLRKYEDVPNPNGNGHGYGNDQGNGASRQPEAGPLNVDPSSSRSFQLHRRSDDTPQVINLSDDDKKAALKALKEVEYENRQSGGFQPAGSRSAAPRPVSARPLSPRRTSQPDDRMPDDRTPDSKPFVMGIPAQASVLEEPSPRRTVK